jgi:hypothetical protein
MTAVKKTVQEGQGPLAGQLRKRFVDPGRVITRKVRYIHSKNIYMLVCA